MTLPRPHPADGWALTLGYLPVRVYRMIRALRSSR